MILAVLDLIYVEMVAWKKPTAELARNLCIDGKDQMGGIK
jgi:hypothetical protein